jgi:hypothetical protein
MAAPALGLKDLCQTLKLPTVAREAERLEPVYDLLRSRARKASATI